MKSDLWATIAAERGALAGDLADLTAAQWATPSLCSGWTVRDIVAHLSSTASLNPGTFFLGMAKARFDFERFANDQIAKHRGADPAATLAEFRGLQNSTSAPPGPKTSWLGEVVIHGADVGAGCHRRRVATRKWGLGRGPAAVAAAGDDRPRRRLRRSHRPRRANAAEPLYPDAPGVIDTTLWRSWPAGCCSGRRTISSR